MRRVRCFWGTVPATSQFCGGVSGSAWRDCSAFWASVRGGADVVAAVEAETADSLADFGKQSDDSVWCVLTIAKNPAESTIASALKARWGDGIIITNR